MTNTLGQATQYGYDAVGRRTTVTNAAGRTTSHTLDARARMTRMTYPDSTSTQYGYDGMGRQVTQTDQSGRVTTKGYDDAGQLTSVTDALSQITRYSYDGNGNLLTQTDALNRVTSYQWDALNRRTRRTLPLAMFETYGYDAVGNMTPKTDFNGKTTAYLYDTLNRLLRKTPDASFGAAAVQFTYTPTGQRATMTDASGVTTYGYDNRDRVLTKATPQGTLTYSYDAASNVTSIRSSNVNGTWVTYGYDALNRVGAVSDQRTGGVTSTTYDVVGNTARVTYPNGALHNFTYDTLERLTSVGGYSYTLAATGHRLSATAPNGRRSGYSYDSIYRLTSEAITLDPTPANNGTLGYALDAVGNRLSRSSTLGALPSATHTYDANDRISGDTFDSNGNTLTSSGNTYQYDFEDRLIRVNTVTMVYDGDGNRVSKTAGANTTKYLVDELNPTGYSQVVDEIVNGAVQRTYTYGLQRVSQNFPSPSMVVNYYGYDGHGSVRFLTDAAGLVTDAYEYDAFGSLVASTGTTLNHNLYTGEQFDADVGAYYLRARWYNTRTGRFLTADSWEGCICSPPSRHLYQYAHGDPGQHADPTGRGILDQAILIGVFIGQRYPLIGALALGRVAFCAVATVAFILHYVAGRPEEEFPHVPCLSIEVINALRRWWNIR